MPAKAQLKIGNRAITVLNLEKALYRGGSLFQGASHRLLRPHRARPLEIWAKSASAKASICAGFSDLGPISNPGCSIGSPWVLSGAKLLMTSSSSGRTDPRPHSGPSTSTPGTKPRVPAQIWARVRRTLRCVESRFQRSRCRGYDYEATPLALPVA